jgi:hypothetical protein
MKARKKCKTKGFTALPNKEYFTACLSDHIHVVGRSGYSLLNPFLASVAIVFLHKNWTSAIT